MDEKSKATIEKMLLEEQQYLGSKTSKQRRSLQSKLLSATGKSDNSTAKRFWTDQEKQMLLKGMVNMHNTLYSLLICLHRVTDLGPVVQSMSLLRGQLVKCFMTL